MNYDITIHQGLKYVLSSSPGQVEFPVEQVTFKAYLLKGQRSRQFNLQQNH